MHTDPGAIANVVLSGTGLAEGNIDRLILDRFFRGKRAGGGFVDVGAARADLSVSALFRSMGWRILAIEPNPDFCKMHRESGHEILQYACGERDEDGVDFLIVDSHGAHYAGGEVSFESFSSLSIKESYRALAKDLDVRTIKVHLRRFDTILQVHAPEIDHIDILSVDVEGWELEVLRGFSIERYAPKVVVVENLTSASDYRDYMRSCGYLMWRRVPPNEIYVNRGMLGRIHVLIYGLMRTFLLRDRVKDRTAGGRLCSTQLSED